MQGYEYCIIYEPENCGDRVGSNVVSLAGVGFDVGSNVEILPGSVLSVDITMLTVNELDI